MPYIPQVKQVEQITVQQFYDIGRDPLGLSMVGGVEGMRHLIRDKSVNRPALVLTGYFKSFAAKRIQLFGAGEMAYLRDLPEDRQEEVLTGIARKHIPCMVVSRQLVPVPAMFAVADRFSIPLMRTRMTSRDFLSTATLLLDDQFAPRVTEHGTLMDVKGIGTLIRGESGVGKSESALALIERGHSLVADDFVSIRLINERELLGTSSELNRGYMECRGLGIVNIAELFGIRSVRREKRIDMVVTFQEWKPGMDEERTGLETETYEILGIPVPHVRLPVRPGRDMARLVEVAAMTEALKQMGHDSAREFNERLIAYMARQNPPPTPAD